MAKLFVPVILCILFRWVTPGYTTEEGHVTPNHSSHKNNDWVYKSLEMSYISLNVLDLMLTFQSLDRGANEANPLVRPYIHNKPLAIVIKGGVTTGILWTFSKIKKDHRKAAFIGLTVLNLFYGAVVGNNLRIYFQL